jgi:hypothetical protein
MPFAIDVPGPPGHKMPSGDTRALEPVAPPLLGTVGYSRDLQFIQDHILNNSTSLSLDQAELCTSDASGPCYAQAVSRENCVVKIWLFPTARPLQGGKLEAGKLWTLQPVVVCAIRRPGCSKSSGCRSENPWQPQDIQHLPDASCSSVLCRYQARELWLGLKDVLENQGVGMFCVLHEWRER